jgi:branched-chain amino acid transport system ATP-binding protein
MKALEVNNIDTYYGASHVLHRLSLEVLERDLVCLLGRNGAGKTTAIRSIMGMTRPARGSIRIFGEEVAGCRSNRIYAKGARIVPQGRHIFPMLSVEENLQLALIGQSSADFKAETEKAYQMFPLLGQRKRQKGKTLSGGELQMLAIARAIMGPARLLLMDEPSEGLAPVVLTQIERTVRELKQKHITILLAEQNLPFALQVGDYFYVIDNGAIVFSGDKASLHASEEIRLRYLGVAI